MLGRFGLLVAKVSESNDSPKKSIEARLREDVSAIMTNPLSADLHLQYASDAAIAGLHFLAFAEFKSAQYLRGDKPRTAGTGHAVPDVANLSHNQYFRFSSLAREIKSTAGAMNVSVLDVGGGDGRLACFIPNLLYCLAEPTTNGISGTKLPFGDLSFDYVVCCHVLEHIPAGDRYAFLDQLLSKAQRGVILLNPFFIEGTHPEEGTRLVFDITKAEWAKEHLECALPRVEEIEAYAKTRGLQCSIKPNGSITTTMALVFMDHFAKEAGRYEDWEKVNAFFNTKFIDILDSPDSPTAHLVHLARS
jgi:ubiquinone/menaquinone biosynthesis C-methylase UbiE